MEKARDLPSLPAWPPLGKELRSRLTLRSSSAPPPAVPETPLPGPGGAGTHRQGVVLAPLSSALLPWMGVAGGAELATPQHLFLTGGFPLSPPSEPPPAALQCPPRSTVQTPSSSTCTCRGDPWPTWGRQVGVQAEGLFSGRAGGGSPRGPGSDAAGPSPPLPCGRQDGGPAEPPRTVAVHRWLGLEARRARTRLCLPGLLDGTGLAAVPSPAGKPQQQRRPASRAPCTRALFGVGAARRRFLLLLVPARDASPRAGAQTERARTTGSPAGPGGGGSSGSIGGEASAASQPARRAEAKEAAEARGVPAALQAAMRLPGRGA